MLQLDNVSLEKGNKHILSHVSMTIPAGKLVVIIGPNGAGKSSALKIMTGDYQPSFGRVSLNGQPLKQFSYAQLAQLRAVLSQCYEMQFPFKVSEVIEMGAFAFAEQSNELDHQAMFKQAIEMVGVTALLERTFTLLSGGEQQRVQLARVLLQLLPALHTAQQQRNGTPYLLIDEPTASLDLFHQYQVMETAKHVANQGAGVVAVLHDLSLAASFADYIYIMQDGCVVAQGDPKTVLQTANLEKVYHMKAHLFEQNNFHPHLQIALS